jgi:hypothetical protein
MDGWDRQIERFIPSFTVILGSGPKITIKNWNNIYDTVCLLPQKFAV